MYNLNDILKEEMLQQQFDKIAVGVVDFKNNSFDNYSYGGVDTLFDLASLTKPLSLFYLYLKFPTYFDESRLSLLEHRSGLPAWCRLSKNEWKEYILSKEIVPKSNSLYSDIGALRVMLELDSHIDTSDEVIKYWNNDIIFWKNIIDTTKCAVTGVRGNIPIKGVVNDDNAFNLDRFCTHAGGFSTIAGLCRYLLRLNNDYNFITAVPQKKNQRFSLGWDQSFDAQQSLAGKFKNDFVFGHLGFTGTSIWIDPIAMKGNVILTNGCLNSYYERTALNILRKKIGSFIWDEYEFK